MQTMFIVRLLDKNRRVLGWNKIPAETRGDGGLWAQQQFVAECDESGMATALCFHWPDVHVYQTRPLAQPMPVEAGKVVTVGIMDAPMIHINSEALPLPGVTVRSSVTVGIGAARHA